MPQTVALVRQSGLLMSLLSFYPAALAKEEQGPAIFEFGVLEKQLNNQSFDAFLDGISQQPTLRWPKIYSAEYCAEKLKDNEQMESLRARKLALTLFEQLRAYQRKLKDMKPTEFHEAARKLLDLRDQLDQPAYGNIVLRLGIELLITSHISERVVLRDDDLKVLESLAQRNYRWKFGWRTICQMIEEEKGKKLFDYAAMEKMEEWAVYYRGYENPKLLMGIPEAEGALRDREIGEPTSTTEGMLKKRNFSALLLKVQTVESLSAKLPGLMLFKQRGGTFGDEDEKWRKGFKKLMADYLKKPEIREERNWDSRHFLGMLSIASAVAAGIEFL